MVSDVGMEIDLMIVIEFQPKGIDIIVHNAQNDHPSYNSLQKLQNESQQLELGLGISTWYGCQQRSR